MGGAKSNISTYFFIFFHNPELQRAKCERGKKQNPNPQRAKYGKAENPKSQQKIQEEEDLLAHPEVEEMQWTQDNEDTIIRSQQDLESLAKADKETRKHTAVAKEPAKVLEGNVPPAMEKLGFDQTIHR